MNTMQTIANAKGSSLGATKLYPNQKESLNRGDWQKFCYTFKIAQFLALFTSCTVLTIHQEELIFH
jgi:hypothetical protein